MKKRVFSFVIMVVTLVALIAFGAPNIKNKTKVGMEFNGGFDILYEVNSNSSELSTAELAKTAAEGIEKRLDISNIINPIVSVEGNKYVRVTVSASNQIIAEDIRNVIENNAEISFRNQKNELKATGDEILSEVGAELKHDDYSNPYIVLNIKDTELLGKITEEISGLGEGNNNLVIWLGYEDGDDYANLSTDVNVAKKIISNAPVTSKLTQEQIVLSGNFSESAAQMTVNLINSGTIDYKLNIVQISTIETNYAEKSFDKVLIASLVAILLVTLALSIYYKLGGLVSSLALIFNTFLTLTLFVTFKGILNQQAIAALIVSIAIAVDSIIIIFERVKNELYNGKKLDRALNEGYKKSISAIVDANIVALIMAIVMFFFGTSVASFALMLALSSLSTIVVMTLANKLLLNSLVKLNVKPTSFGAKKAYLENKELYLNNKFNKIDTFKNNKKHYLGIGIFATVSLVTMLVLQLTLGNMFNYNNTIKENASITIVSNKSYFTDETHIREFFNQKGVELTLNEVTISESTNNGLTEYKVSVTTDESITAIEGELKDKISKAYGENTELEDNYELYINDINPKSATISLLSALYTVGIGILISGVYLAIRYRYSYAIASIVSTIASIALTILFFGLTRIKIGSDAIISIFAISVFSTNTLIVIFNRLKEIITTKNKKYISNEERYEALNKSINVSLSRTILTTAAIIIVSISLLAFATLTNYSFYITLIVGIIASSYCAIIFASKIWLLFEKRTDKKKRTFKPKNKSSKFKELEEHVFIGIND